MTAPALPNPKPVVLVVDDVPDNVRVVGHIIRDENVEIAIAGTGQEALALAAESPPDLILLDIMLPDLDGYEVCRRLKIDVATATIPIIFLTARADTDDIVKGFEVGGVDYVIKPFRPAELRARVRTHLQLRQLKSLLAICSYCNRIRGSNDHWERFEHYIAQQTGTRFTHGICPECFEKLTAKLGL